MDLYVQALYVTQLSQDAKQILDNRAEMAITLRITSVHSKFQQLSKRLKGMEKISGQKKAC
jgi:hypothetical protein